MVRSIKTLAPTIASISRPQIAHGRRLCVPESHLVKVHQGSESDRMSTLIKPLRVTITEFTGIHGITATSPLRHECHYALRFLRTSHVCTQCSPIRGSGELDEFFRTQTLPSDLPVLSDGKSSPRIGDYKRRPSVPGFRLGHHDATSDAEACALIVAALQQRKPLLLVRAPSSSRRAPLTVALVPPAKADRKCAGLSPPSHRYYRHPRHPRPQQSKRSFREIRLGQASKTVAYAARASGHHQLQAHKSRRRRSTLQRRRG